MNGYSWIVDHKKVAIDETPGHFVFVNLTSGLQGSTDDLQFLIVTQFRTSH